MVQARNSRVPADWDPRYRLEALSGGSAARPFRYTLRKLPAGVMGRTVLGYSPEDAPVFAKR